MARCSCCKKQDREITKDGKRKIKFSLFKARGGVYCPHCLGIHVRKLFPGAKEEKAQKPGANPLIEKRRENCLASMVAHNTVELQVYAVKISKPKVKEMKAR